MMIYENKTWTWNNTSGCRTSPDKWRTSTSGMALGDSNNGTTVENLDSGVCHCENYSSVTDVLTPWCIGLFFVTTVVLLMVSLLCLAVMAVAGLCCGTSTAEAWLGKPKMGLSWSCVMILMVPSVLKNAALRPLVKSIFPEVKGCWVRRGHKSPHKGQCTTLFFICDLLYKIIPNLLLLQIIYIDYCDIHWWNTTPLDVLLLQTSVSHSHFIHFRKLKFDQIYILKIVIFKDEDTILLSKI